MGWVKRKADEHQCRKPSWKGGESVGDIWQCDTCHFQWRITKIEFEDRPCGAIWITWARHFDNDGPGVTSWRDS